MVLSAANGLRRSIESNRVLSFFREQKAELFISALVQAGADWSGLMYHIGNGIRFAYERCEFKYLSLNFSFERGNFFVSQPRCLSPPSIYGDFN